MPNIDENFILSLLKRALNPKSCRRPVTTAHHHINLTKTYFLFYSDIYIDDGHAVSRIRPYSPEAFFWHHEVLVNVLECLSSEPAGKPSDRRIVVGCRKKMW